MSDHDLWQGGVLYLHLLAMARPRVGCRLSTLGGGDLSLGLGRTRGDNVDSRSPMRPRLITCIVTLAAGVGALIPAPGAADVGVETASPSAGRPGDEVTLTLVCGFCLPPCEGAPGHRRPSPCMLGTKASPPAAFPILLLPDGKLPQNPRAAAGRDLLAPRREAPRQAPFTYIGEAVLRPDTTGPAEAAAPRYVLEFEIPSLPSGTYTYVLYCEVCMRGKAGSLIPEMNTKQLLVRAQEPAALGALLRLMSVLL